jgi:O-antigen ligase
MRVTQQANSRVMGWFAFVAVVAFCLWAPAVLGSNRPYLWAINGTILSGIAILTRIGLPQVPQASRAPLQLITGAIFALLLLWIGISAVMGEAVSQIEWISVASVQILLSEVRPLASYSQSDSTLILIALVSHALLWWIVVQLVHQGFGKFLYWSILCVVIVHALAGLTEGFGQISLSTLPRQPETIASSAGFVNRNHFATYLGLGAVVAAALALRNARQMIYEGVRISVVLQLFLSSVALMLITLALFFTQSRMGLAASAMGVLVVILLHGIVCQAWGLMITSAVLYCLVVVLGVFLMVDVLERFVAAEIDISTRLDIYRQAIELWQIRPWTGFGAGSFETVFSTIRDGQLLSGAMITRAHNSYITVLVEMGVIGSLIVLSLFICLGLEQARALGRHHYFSGLVGLACLVVLGVHSSLDFSGEIYAVMSLLVVLLAASTGFSQRRSHHSISARAGAHSMMRPAGAGSAGFRVIQVPFYPRGRNPQS